MAIMISPRMCLAVMVDPLLLGLVPGFTSIISEALQQPVCHPWNDTEDCIKCFPASVLALASAGSQPAKFDTPPRTLFCASKSSCWNPKSAANTDA
eukprot:1161987-Pelagomonas_calceolata.AAC.1